MHKVVTLACPGAAMFELGIPSRVLGAARLPSAAPAYDVTVVAAPGDEQITTKEGLTITTADAAQLASADTVVIASSDELLDLAVRRDLAERVAPLVLKDGSVRPRLRIASVCSGAFLLGELGLLDHRRATTHWRLADRLASQFPRTQVQEASLYVEDNDVLTSGGVAAGIDLCLHMIRRDHGVTVANDVARRCIVAPFREGGQAQYIQDPVQRSADASTHEVIQWLLATLNERHTLASIARRAHMSTRTFERRFRAEQGTSPGQWLTAARIQQSKALLETTDLSVERIAEQVGLGTASNLRAHFTRCVGRTPQAYRRTFTPPEPIHVFSRTVAQPAVNANGPGAEQS